MIKRALVLSGGGSKGAYQVGALKALLPIEYDMFCGVSVGALNVSFLALHNNLRNGVNELEKIWSTFNTKDIYKKWFMWPLSVLWKPSIYNSKPLEEWVESTLSMEKTLKPVYVGATSLKTGKYHLYDWESPQYIDAVIASASYPGFFKPVQINDEYFIDGGVRNVTPLKAAIEAGATHIDCIVLDSEGMYENFEKPKSLKVLMRSLNIILDEIIENDIRTCMLYNKHNLKKKIELRVFRPQIPLGNNPLAFTPEVSVKLIQQGYEETLRVLNV